MANKFFEEDTDTVTIPDFVEERISDNTDTMTDSTSVDMSIFKMSDEELYDDVDQNDQRVVRSSSSNSTVILSFLLICLLLVTSLVSVIYALKQKKAYSELNAKYLQVQANQEAFQKQISEKDAQITDLQKKLEQSETKTPVTNGTKDGDIYKVVDGPLTFRVAPGMDAEETTFDGKQKANTDEKYVVIEVIEDEYDKGRFWAKLADDVYFLVSYQGYVWSEKTN